MQINPTSAHNDTAAYLAALAYAERRALHSFFDQHVIEDEFGCFLAVDEGDYNALPQDLIDRIVHSVPGMMADDFDEANIARAASFISVVMDPEWDADCPF